LEPNKIYGDSSFDNDVRWIVKMAFMTMAGSVEWDDAAAEGALRVLRGFLTTSTSKAPSQKQQEQKIKDVNQLLEYLSRMLAEVRDAKSQELSLKFISEVRYLPWPSVLLGSVLPPAYEISCLLVSDVRPSLLCARLATERVGSFRSPETGAS
jgi:hypothetical protein